MSDRPYPILEAPACPFVAFDDDRDRRSDQPDHRHRCFAELRPAPRALAHQHAYCLSSSFAACPTFQDWARREAAQIDVARGRAGRDAGADAAAATGAAAGMAVADRQEPPRVDAYDREASAADYPRDWAATPSWLGGAAAASGATTRSDRPDAAPTPGEAAATSPAQSQSGAADVEAVAPAFLAGRQRDQAASAGQPAAPRTPPDPDRGFFGPGPGGTEPWSDEIDEGEGEGSAPAGSGTPRADRRRTPAGAVNPGRRRDDNPSWEPRRRMEAYPTLKSPVSLPSFGRLGLGLVALLVAAVALFFVPMLLAPKTPGTTGGGGGESPSASAPVATPSASASSVTPSPSAAIYVVKSGDTLSRIAAKLGVGLDALIAANPQLKDPNKLAIGDQLNIPTPPPSEVTGPSESPSPS